VSPPRVAVVGGGVAGIAAALRLAKAGAEPTVYEVRPRLGGAAYSFSRDGLLLDNGVHVLLRCCTAYAAFLEELGSLPLIRFQDRLAVPFLGPAGLRAEVARANLPPPLHLAGAFLRYRPLSLGERAAGLLAAARLARIDPADPSAKERSVGEFLAGLGCPPRVGAELFEPILLPLLNATLADCSLSLAAFALKTGFLASADGCDIGFHEAPLLRIIGEPAAARLAQLGAAVELGARVCSLRREGEGWLLRVERRGELAERGPFAAVVIALPHRRAAVLLEEAEVGERERRRLERLAAELGRLAVSPIVNLHLIFASPVTDLPFFGGLRSPVQFVFDRSRQAGLAGGQYLAISLSAARREMALSSERLKDLYLPALAQLLPVAAKVPLEAFYVSKEHAATFLPAPGSERLRPGPASGVGGLLLAGAYTATGWPATLEGAVRSGWAAAAAAVAELEGLDPTATRKREDAGSLYSR